MCWSIDRLGQSVLHVANAMAELDAAGVSLYSDQQAIDSTNPFGKAMIQMAFKAAPHGVLEHLIEGRAFVPTLGATDASVLVRLHNLPASMLGLEQDQARDRQRRRRHKQRAGREQAKERASEDA
jgi:hypothetical protein